MKKNPLPFLLMVSLILAMISAPCLVLADPKPVIVTHLKGALEADAQLKAIIGNVTWIEWVVVTDELTSTDLSGAVMLFMVLADSSLTYTDAELNAVKSWFDEGGKAIWISGDSDYGDDRLRQPVANSVFEKVGSVLRIEQCQVSDPIENAGADYRLLGLSEKCDDDVKFLVSGVTKALFHSPGAIITFSGGKYNKLDVEKPEGVYRIMFSSETSMIVNNEPPDPEIHEVGDEGTFVVMAMQLFSETKNVVIATGDAPFDQYAGMYMPEIRVYERYTVDYPQQGARLFENILTYVVHYSEKLMGLENQVKTQEEQVATLEGEVHTLGGQVATLQDEVTTLEGEKTSLEGEKATLEGRVTTLEGEVTSLKGSLGTWQGIAAATFVIGLIIGVAVIYMMKR